MSDVEVPAYLKILWRYKWLLMGGLIVSLVAGFFAGYTFGPNGLRSRTVKSYSATTTLLVTSATDTLYQAEIPSQPRREGYTDSQSIDLSNTAVIYAYIISGSGLQDEVALQIGAIDPSTESISAVRRSTQPGGNERFPGNLRLPVIDIVSTAPTPERATEMTAATTSTFLAYVQTEQDKRQLQPQQRVQIRTLHVGTPLVALESNPNVPVVFTAFGLMVALIALIFALHAFRTLRESRKQDAEVTGADSDHPDPGSAVHPGSREVALVPARAYRVGMPSARQDSGEEAAVPGAPAGPADPENPPDGSQTQPRRNATRSLPADRSEPGDRR
jgi:hypothetical protein